MTKEDLRNRFYVETGILEPFERLEEYMSWLESNLIELSKLHQPTVSDSLPDDEEIERKAEFRQRSRNPKNTAKGEFIYGFIQGAEWIIDMISSNEV